MFGRSQKMEAPSLEVASDPTPPEVRAYKEAEAVADARVGFYKHVVVWGMCVLFLAFTADLGSAITVGLLWGIFLAAKGYNAIWAPELRQRYIQEELSRAVRQALAEKQQLAGRHAKDLETLSASIAHEIRNPITAAKSLVQQIGEDPSSAENVEYAKIAIDELDRVEKSISHLLRYAREEGIQLESIQVKDVVESALETFKDRVRETGVEIERELDDVGPMRADPEKLRRVMINLIGNAIDGLEEAGVTDPKIAIASGRNLAGSELWISVKDNGPGIESERIDDIWQPFHTSKAQGTGLGLAITKKLVEAHEGTIEVRSELGVGTEFMLRFKRSGVGA